MDIQKMMQQAKTMQDKMQNLQAQLADKEVEGSSGGGMVKVRMSCKGECKGIEIDPSMIKDGEKEILEDLLKAALNDAKGRADATLAEETQKLMAEMGLPANMQMPF
ncbi:MAG: YbaB/EbfC family nucleoid-associated protein [Rhodospirillales bacterium]|nr:YbaB/EbfC family nucleoid-associated protein [Alphaproteobacteria bacterium]USO04392.1 MAG: YbaB/EbfC family nucleoid-associated protein [Rhodospirillales bacterium]